MTRQARRLMALVVVLALVVMSITPAFAIGITPGLDGPGTAFDRITGSEGLKHPTLDSKLYKISRDVATGKQSHDAIARQAKVSRGSTVAVAIHVADDPAPIVDWLKAHGATVDGVGERLVEAYVPVTELASLGAQDGVLAVDSILPPVSKVISQGLAPHGVPNWNFNGFTGAGVKVGVIDVGFEGIVALVGSELPQMVMRCYPVVGGPTSNLSDCQNGGVHGTAVAETLYDVAPGVTLYVSNPGSWLELKQTVEWMVSEGVTVINHSVGWTWNGPGDGTTVFNDSPLRTVELAVAGGITWVNAAGNEGLATWSGDYRDANGDNILEFAAGGIDLNSVPGFPGQSIDVMLRWDDSWGGADTDLDLYLLDGFANIVATSEEPQNGGSGHTPFEFLSYTPLSSGYYYIAIEHFGGNEPDWIQIQEFNGLPLGLSTAEYSVANPAESANPGLLAVGAAPWFAPDSIEDFSSQGPTRDGRIKPDVVGIDQADTVSYGASGFPGTSQASPHVAGLAALVKQRYPGYGPAEVAQYLRSNASQASTPNNVWGYGLAHLPEIVDGENPVPMISSLSPSSVQLGTFPLTITVNGSGFMPESVVRWNGQDRETTYISANQLTFEVNYLDTDFPSTVEVTVVNPGPGGGTSNVAPFTITDGTMPVAVDHPEFHRTWQRTDEPVKQIVVSRTWMWGDGPASEAMTEEYAGEAGDYRSVKYFDKSRMEVNDPNADASESWFVTNGLLSKELITGEMQMGDDDFVDHGSAEVPVAGDPDDDNGPTYASFSELLDAQPYGSGATITQRIDRDGNITDDASLAEYGVTAAELVEVPGIRHQVASVFWEFMNSTGVIYENGEFTNAQLFDPWFYATGLPITEAYWAEVKINGEYLDVLMQCFERRCLTYNPANPDGWKVEAGNVGLHYYMWRYETQSPPPSCDPSYPDFCIPPPPPDLDCGDAPIAGHTHFTVLSPDPHGLDTDGDGIGCETGTTPSDDVPIEGTILYESSFNDWPSYVDNEGDSGVAGIDAYVMAIGPLNMFGVLNAGPYGDASSSVDIFAVAPTDSGLGCLVFKAATEGAYYVCARYSQGVASGIVAMYLDVGQPLELARHTFQTSVPADQLLNLKVITKGDQFWFFVGGVEVGTGTHNGSSSGQVGIAFICSDDVDPCGGGFKNMVVRQVE